MKIPKSEADLIRFTEETIGECRVSADERRKMAATFRSVYYTGQLDATSCRHNKCFTSVDKTASYLFSPAEARFSVTFEADETADWGDIADASSRHVNREIMRHGIDTAFGQAVDMGLIEGCSFMKLNWSHQGYSPELIRQHQMGVLREDIDDLDRQDAFTHSYYLTESQFKRLIINHSMADRREILEKVQSGFTNIKDNDGYDSASFFQQIVAGGLNPVTLGAPSGNTAMINIYSRPPELRIAPEVGTKLIQVHDLWIYDDEAEDYVTIRYVDPGLLIEGKYRLQNLGDIPKQHPFVKVCPNEVVNYMWGRSELANLADLQGLLNARWDDLNRLIKLKVKPPRSFRGFSNITAEQQLALYTPGGTLTDSNPANITAVDSFAPDIPAELMPFITQIETAMDDIAGFNNVLSGQGDQGIRGNAQANTMIRTSSPRIRDRALLVERQYGALGHKCLQMSQAKDASVYRTTKAAGGVLSAVFGMGKSKEPQKFMLSQLPDDATVTVYAHTSSPAFSQDNVNLAFALQRAGAIDGEDVIDMVNAPNADKLILKLRGRQEAQAKFLQEHPEIAAKQAGKRR